MHQHRLERKWSDCATAAWGDRRRKAVRRRFFTMIRARSSGMNADAVASGTVVMRSREKEEDLSVETGKTGKRENRMSWTRWPRRGHHRCKKWQRWQNGRDPEKSSRKSRRRDPQRNDLQNHRRVENKQECVLLGKFTLVCRKVTVSYYKFSGLFEIKFLFL